MMPRTPPILAATGTRLAIKAGRSGLDLGRPSPPASCLFDWRILRVPSPGPSPPCAYAGTAFPDVDTPRLPASCSAYTIPRLPCLATGTVSRRLQTASMTVSASGRWALSDFRYCRPSAAGLPEVSSTGVSGRRTLAARWESASSQNRSERLVRLKSSAAPSSRIHDGSAATRSRAGARAARRVSGSISDRFLRCMSALPTNGSRVRRRVSPMP